MTHTSPSTGGKNLDGTDLERITPSGRIDSLHFVLRPFARELTEAQKLQPLWRVTLPTSFCFMSRSMSNE